MHRPRVSLIALIALLAAFAAPTATASASQKLTGPDAKHLVKIVLKDKFGGGFQHGDGKNINCRRVSRIRMRCKVRWGIGDSSYNGRVAVWYRVKDKDHFYFDYRIEAVNEYCIATGGSRDECTKVYD